MSIDPENPLAVEIRQEMANAYFAACKKMVDALEALRQFEREMPASSDSPQNTRRAQLLAEARERVFYVVIQREAMKLPTLEFFFENYEIPEEIRARLGPKS